MGEEWAASTPFLFFCDFEPGLAKLVTDGRRREFEAWPQFADAAVRATIPDPSALATFETSQLRWEERELPQHAAALAFATELLRLRARYVLPVNADVRGSDAVCERIGAGGLALRWKLADGVLCADANLGDEPLDGFPERLPGETFYATHEATYRGGRAPAWAVRWSRA
jgi:maltooligosyltrehalose trehalohydrolase